MKKINITLKKLALLAIILTGFIACEKDFASLESDVINSGNATNFDSDVATYPVTTYNKKISPFQSNGLPMNLLGYHNDNVFGSTSANFVGQMAPSSFDPGFGNNTVLDSVVLTVPYLSTGISTAEDGTITYRLDSIYGETPIKLSIFQNEYFLRDFNPGSDLDDKQKYYSNGSVSQTQFINPGALEGHQLFTSDSFLPDAKQIILTELDDNGEKVESGKLTPAMRLHLFDPSDPADTFWHELILDKEGEPELSNLNNFTNYFRGLYFKAESTSADGTMMLLNFSNTNANITLYYSSETENPETNGEPIEQEGTYVLNFSGNLINILDNNFINIPDGDEVNGDEKLYLKGGEGSMAVINLFNGDENGNSTVLDQFRDEFNNGANEAKRLINEAYLEFYVDQSIVNGNEPDRIYLYDIENNTALLDYFLDQSVSDLTINAKINHLEPLQRVGDESDGEGIKYKIRITEHINNIFIRDSTNVKLGLVVTSNVGSIDPFALQNDENQIIPTGTILSPKGTVLIGSNTADEDKKVKLKIYYTEPEN